ncbi:SDR family oxidoreductase [Bauldia litoralis]|uniref:SDR family oxidoreductase n=1 Tax=Bauldia litoralis TaxID=665467 RepID=UPI0032642A21
MSDTKKIAMVTGAGSGIGKAAVLALAAEGYACVLAGRRLEPIEAVAAEITGNGGEAIAVSADVGDPGSVEALFARTKEAYGRLDVIFNNAGINVAATPLEDLDFDKWQSVVAANLTGVFLCAQGAYRLMKAQDPQGGRIINNGSISAHTPRPNAIAYNATKHGVSGITKSVALEGRPYGIACGQIDIGNAATDMTQRMSGGVLQANGSLAPEPTMNVKAVADAIVYMAGLPLDANVLTMTVMATNMPFVGRG